MPYSISVKQPALGAAPEGAKSKPHHVKNNDGTINRFKNPHPSYKAGFQPWEFPIKAIMGQFDGSMVMPQPKGETVPIRTPEFLTSRRGSSSSQGGLLRTTWLGHACHYAEFPSGLRVLFDPVMEDRCSPFSFAGPRRYTRAACRVADLPFLDAVVISHNHYDHLSLSTVREVRARFPKAQFFVGLGLGAWFRASGVDGVTEMDWWEDAEVTVRPDEDDNDGDNGEEITATVSCLPAQHGSARSPFDHEKTLWCSWAVTSGAKSAYFAGDTGYRSVPAAAVAAVGGGDEATHGGYGGDGHDEEEKQKKQHLAGLPTNPDFAAIGSLRGPFDVGLIPIGAYAPRVLMSPLHASPADAVEIFRDTRCRAALAIHWGTWALTSEPVMEPPQRLREALGRRGIAEEGVFDICDIGETRVF